MSRSHAGGRCRRMVPAALAAVAGLFAAAPASAQVDLEIRDVEVTQAVRNFATPLIADNVTYVRVFVDHANGSSVPNVDGIVRVFIGGVEADFSPLRSINGPINAPANPNDFTTNHHLNFAFVPPEATDVDLRIILDPFDVTGDPDLSNNVLSVDNLIFQCRRVVDLTYVPINYTPGGGLPDEALTQPGVGDGFTRGIFKPGAWDYHRSPLGPLLWTQDINGSNNALLNVLSDIRQSQIPSAGFPRPTFIYGWLPGNPFSGNGQANGLPGDAAFGNTQSSRFQRTFAHEMGHLFGNPHNGNSTERYGIDVEHHLRTPLNLPQFLPETRLDIMVAGQLTAAAWVTTNIYRDAINDPRFACSGFNDLGDPVKAVPQPALRIAGEIEHLKGGVRLDPAMLFPHAITTDRHYRGTLFVVLRDADGNEIYRVRTAPANTRAMCSDPDHEHPELLPTSPLHVVVPESVDGVLAERYEVVEVLTGDVLAAVDRSPAAPVVSFEGLDLIGGGPVVIDRPTRIRWTGSDADGDELTYSLLYSPDGEAWLPIVPTTDATEVMVDPNVIPRNEQGRLRLVASDGFNATIIESGEIAMLGGGQPEVYILSPNNFNAFSERNATVFHGYAYDLEDQTIDAIEWNSSVDGNFASGRLVTADNLTPGLHQITASVTDTDGNVAVSASIGIVIQARDQVTPDLDGNGTVGFDDLLELLTLFGPCGDFCPGDIDEDGQVAFSDLLILLAAWDA